MPKKLHVSKWDPATFEPGNKLLISGRSGSGKSTILEEILAACAHKFDLIVAYTPTRETQDMLRKITYDEFIHESFKPAHFAEMCQELDEMDRLDNKHRSVLVILDDCGFDKKVLNSDAMRQAMMNGRHWPLSIINVIQYVMDMPIGIRSQQTYVINLGEKGGVFRKKLFEQFYEGVFRKREAWEEVFDHLTADWGAIVLNNKSQSTDPEKSIASFRVDLNDPERPRLTLNARPSLEKLHSLYYISPEERRQRRVQSEFPKKSTSATKKRKKPSTTETGEEGECGVDDEEKEKVKKAYHEIVIDEPESYYPSNAVKRTRVLRV